MDTPDPLAAVEAAAAEAAATVVRTSRGTFLPGVSGNPAGRAKGSKNAITLRRLETEEAMRNFLAPRAKAILKKATEMALSGDTVMLKTLLDKMLSSLRNEDVGDSKDTNVNVTFTNLTRVAKDRESRESGAVVEGEIIPPTAAAAVTVSLPKPKPQEDPTNER